MQTKLIVAIAAVALAGLAQAQTTNRTAGEAARDTANNVGAAAKAAVTPGDQNMGRTPDNRSGGLMGNDRAGAAGRAAEAAVTPGDQNMGRTPDNRSGGLMGTDRNTTDTATTTRRRARADRN
jgi:hypothetical protein